MLLLIITNCNRKSDIENQITIKIYSIDKESNQRRVDAFDTVDISKESSWYFLKSFPTERKYITDSTGLVKIKIDSTKIYNIIVSGVNVLGGEIYYPGFLKDGQEVNIEVRRIDKN